MSPFVITTSSNSPLMGDMGVGCEVKGDTGVDWCWTWILLMNYLKISTEELSNLEEDRRETK